MIVRETQAVMLELKDVDFKSSLNREIINLLDSLSDEELASFHMENNHTDLIINILKIMLSTMIHLNQLGKLILLIGILLIPW